MEKIKEKVLYMNKKCSQICLKKRNKQRYVDNEGIICFNINT